jgi:hypothetical protein
MGLGAFEGLLAKWTTFWGIFMLVEVQVRHGLAGAGVGSRKLNASPERVAGARLSVETHIEIWPERCGWMQSQSLHTASLEPHHLLVQVKSWVNLVFPQTPNPLRLAPANHNSIAGL